MRFRKLRIACSVAWAIVAVLLVALWVRSYKTADCLYWNIVGHRSVLFASTGGRLVAYTSLFEINSAKTTSTFRLLDSDTIGMTVIYPLASGVPCRSIGGTPAPNSRYIVTSHWLAAILVVSASAVGAFP